MPYTYYGVIQQHDRRPIVHHTNIRSHLTFVTQSPEPILMPKVRIYSADFPYLHYSQPEASNLGDLMRFLVRSQFIYPFKFSWIATNAWKLTNTATFLQEQQLFAVRHHSKSILMSTRKGNSDPSMWVSLQTAIVTK